MSIHQDTQTTPSPEQSGQSGKPAQANTNATSNRPNIAPNSGAKNAPDMDNDIDNKLALEKQEQNIFSEEQNIVFEEPTSPDEPTKASFFSTLFTVADALPYLSILLLGLLAFGNNAFKTNLWMLHGQGILDMLKSPQVANIATGIDTNALVLWPASMFLLQTTLLESAFSPEITYAWLAVILHTLILGASYLLARTTGSSSKQALAATCIIVASPVYLSMYNLDVVSLLLTFCLLLSFICFYRGWLKERATSWLISAFCFTALAGFSAGIYWMLLPCLASLIFLAWRCTFTRVDASDSVLAFALFLCIFAGIIGFYAFQPMGREYLKSLLETMQTTWAWKWDWGTSKNYLKVFALLALPWTLLLSFNLLRNLRKLPKSFITARTQAPGQAWLWWTLATSFFVIAFMPNLRLADTYIVWPLASILFANALLNLTPKQSHLFFTLCSIFLTCCGVWLLYLAVTPPTPTIFFKDTPLIIAPFFLQEFVVVAKLVLLGALLIFMAYALDAFINTNRPEGALVALTLAICLWMAAATYMAPDVSIPNIPLAPQKTMPSAPKPDRLTPETPDKAIGEIPEITPEMQEPTTPETKEFEALPVPKQEIMPQRAPEIQKPTPKAQDKPLLDIQPEAQPKATPEALEATPSKPLLETKPETAQENPTEPSAEPLPEATPEPEPAPAPETTEPTTLFQL